MRLVALRVSAIVYDNNHGPDDQQKKLGVQFLPLFEVAESYTDFRCPKKVTWGQKTKVLALTEFRGKLFLAFIDRGTLRSVSRSTCPEVHILDWTLFVFSLSLLGLKNAPIAGGLV